MTNSDHFEHLNESKFKFENLDLVAVPDFSAGAMENWGLITFRYCIFKNVSTIDVRENNLGKIYC